MKQDVSFWVGTVARLLAFGALFVAITSMGAVFPALPFQLATFEFWILVASLCAGWLLLYLLDRRPLGALGFAWTSQSLREIGWGLLIGGGPLAACVLVLAIAGEFRFTSESGTIASYLQSLIVPFALFAVAAAAEEALFRGYPFQVLVRAMGAVPAAILASGLFALAHRNNPNVGTLSLINIFLAGVMLSAAYLRTRSLWFATAVHLGWNWTMGTVLDLPVSGLRIFDTPYYDLVPRGPAWLTGGDFGPEGGVLAAVAFVVMSAAILRLLKITESPRIRSLRPIVDDRLIEERNGG